MKLKTKTKEIPISGFLSETMRRGIHKYPALKINLPNGISTEEVNEILTGVFDILDDDGNVILTYEGYTTLGEISVIVGKITTADERVEELEAELTDTKGKLEEVNIAHAEYRETVQDILPALDDKTALSAVSLFPVWEDCVEARLIEAPEGFRFSYNGYLYRCKNPNPTFQQNWVPGEGTESLYERIEVEHEGTLEDPMPYTGNMELLAGKYYEQDGVVYLCNRNTETAVYNKLAELVGLYVEIA